MIRTAIFLSLALAFATTAYAQDSAPTDPAAATSDQTADASNASAAAPAMTHHMKKHHHHHMAAMAMTGDDAKAAAYQSSDRQKAYPAVDHAHVPGDPPVIDHSADQAAVTPTSSKITIPPSH